MPSLDAVSSGDEKSLFWPYARIRDAHENLILKGGLPLTSQVLPGAPRRASIADITQWLRRAPRSLGLDVIEEKYISLDVIRSRLLLCKGPILLILEARVGEYVVLTAILEPGPRATVLTPDGSEVRLARITLFDAVAKVVASGSESLTALFDGMPGGSDMLKKVQESGALTEGRDSMLMRFVLDSAHPIRSQVSSAGGWKALAAHAGLSALQAAAAVGAYWALGNTMLDGQVDWDRIVGWALLAASDAPLQYLANLSFAEFSIALGAAVKRRSLEGTFFISEQAVRADGFGTVIARANEASVVEQLSLGEASGVFAAALQVIGAGIFLARGAATIPALLLLGLAIVVATLVVRANVRTYQEVFTRRMALTDDLVDKIIGHRTRAAQQSPRERHASEDFELSEYTKVAQRLDRIRALASVMPRLWLTAGASVLLIAFVTQASVDQLIFSGLGIMLCYRAFVAFFPAVTRLVEWYSAWRGIEYLVTFGEQRSRASRAADAKQLENLDTTLVISAASFAYRPGGRPVIIDANLRVNRGEKLLLEGASGSGKTTLFKLIVGERPLSNGIILVGGSDRFYLSDIEWRQRVASAPQFHENHVFANTLSFNLDPWGEPGLENPEARDICEELGLMPLVDRMPQGFAQQLGETGWQLSHGERSRVFIARALLQKAELVLFDENFGALDPENLIRALECARHRAKTLIVIAHT